jgi:hypothetical protein
LDRAATDVVAVEIIGSHLVAQCADFMSSKGFDKNRAKAIMDRGAAILKRWEASKDFFLPLYSQHRLAHAQNYAPLSIFPLDSKSCARLLSGAVQLRAWVNVSAVLREFESKGWQVVHQEIIEMGEAASTLTRDVPMARLRTGRFRISVPATLFGRLGMEFLKPRSLAQLLDAMAEQHDEGGIQIINFAGEGEM